MGRKRKALPVRKVSNPLQGGSPGKKSRAKSPKSDDNGEMSQFSAQASSMAHALDNDSITIPEPWQKTLLESSKLREQLNTKTTGPLQNIETERYFKFAGMYQTSILKVMSQYMHDFQEYSLPSPGTEFGDFTAVEKLAVSRLITAMAESDIDLTRVEKGNDEVEKTARVVRETVKKTPFTSKENPHIYDGLRGAAFELGQISDSTGTLPSSRLKDRITKYLNIYEGNRRERKDDKFKGPVFYHSPYTSIVGPSGSGKTFTVKHLAEKEGIWVIYTSLSQSPTSMPKNGPFLHDIVINNSSSAMELFWKRYIEAGRHLVSAAIQRDITPGMLFRLLYHEQYVDFRERYAEIVRALGDKEKENAVDVESLLSREDLSSLFLWQENTGTSKPVPIDLTFSASSTPIVFCIDEARALLLEHKITAPDSVLGRPLGFRKFRRQLASTAETHPVFGLLLDTLSRVINFSPPDVRDPSAKAVCRTTLFSPLYGVYVSWDAMARASLRVQEFMKKVLVSKNGNKYVVMGPQYTVEWMFVLYALGRPCWGAIMNASVALHGDTEEALRLGIKTVENLVAYKLAGPKEETPTLRDQRLAALIRFRLHFYVSDHQLSEASVADWMHYVRHVSSDRATIQSLSTAEPAIARFVAREMKELETRQSMTDCLVRLLHSGALNEGDAGEIVAGWLLLLAIDGAGGDESTHGLSAGPGTHAANLYKSLADFLHIFLSAHDISDVPLVNESYIYVTHISRLCVESDDIQQQHLQMGFLTGTAFYLPRGFRGVDLLIPVWQGPNRPMTALLVQVKNVQAGDKLTPSRKLGACSDLEAGRKTIAALGSANQCVYGLYINLRPTPSGQCDAGRLAENFQKPAENGMYMFYQMGFNQEMYGFLSEEEHIALRGVVETHLFGFSDLDTEALGRIILTRDGSTFLVDN